MNRSLQPFVPQTKLPPILHGEITRKHRTRRFNDCFNRMPCCEQWAKEGDCYTKKSRMAELCAAACGKCRPSYNASNGTEISSFRKERKEKLNFFWMQREFNFTVDER